MFVLVCARACARRRSRCANGLPGHGSCDVNFGDRYGCWASRPNRANCRVLLTGCCHGPTRWIKCHGVGCTHSQLPSKIRRRLLRSTAWGQRRLGTGNYVLSFKDHFAKVKAMKTVAAGMKGHGDHIFPTEGKTSRAGHQGKEP